MERVLRTARFIRSAIGGRALWNGIRPSYWATMALLSRRSGAALELPDGHRYRLDPRLYAWGLPTFESAVVKVLTDALGADSVVYDIGAHVGLITLMAARRVLPPAGHVYAFEPSPDNFSILQRHLRYNRMEQVVTAAQVLVGETPSAGVMFSYLPGQFTANSLAYTLPGSRTASVPMRSVDDLLERREVRQADVIKIDVEGYEHAVLRGARSFLCSSAPLVVCAIHPDPLAALGTSGAAVIADMSAWGYQAYDLDGRMVTTAGFQEVVFRKRHSVAANAIALGATETK